MSTGDPRCPVHGFGCSGMSDAGVPCSTWMMPVDPIPRPVEARAPLRRPTDWVDLPSGVIRTNGGKRCDMAVGACACGAMHTLDEQRLGAPFVEASTRTRKHMLELAYEGALSHLFMMTPSALRDAAIADLRSSLVHALGVIDMDAGACDDDESGTGE